MASYNFRSIPKKNVNSGAVLYRSLWILGPKSDALFFILPPIFIVPLFLALKGQFQIDTFAIWVLGLGGFGHHLPGFIRAYSDRDLFKRFKLRLTVVPVMIFITCGLYGFLNLNALTLVTAAWGTWHGAMQINGFVRIYDSKAKSFRPYTARLDWLMCLAWFGLAILHSPAKQFSLVTQFYGSGGLLIPPQAFTVIRQVWEITTILITLLFLFNIIYQWKVRIPPSPIKLLTMVLSFAFWWYCTVTLNNLLLGVLMWEVFHDIQYDVLVWFFQRQRVDKNLNASPVEKWLFTKGWSRLVCYTSLVLSYGFIGVITSFGDLNMPERLMSGSSVAQWIFRIILASALLHFYFDGFIWRIRDKSIRQGLNVPDENSVGLKSPINSFVTHGWKWAFFIVPVGYLGFSQYNGRVVPFDSQMRNLAEAIPGSWLAHFFVGASYTEKGNQDSAVTQYRLALKYKPDFAIGHMLLGNLLVNKNEDKEAMEHFLKSIELDSNSLEGRLSLGTQFLKMEQPLSALEQFKAALVMQPENPVATFDLASAFFQLNRISEAEEYLEKTLLLEPNQSKALNYMGVIKGINGDRSTAIQYYQRALQADSTNSEARRNLGEANLISH